MRSYILLVLCAALYVRCQDSSICEQPACNCTSSMTDISCKFAVDQNFTFGANCLPAQLGTFEIINGGQITFQERAFSKINLYKLMIRNVTKVTLESRSFLNLSSNQMFLEIVDCNEVVIETRAFYITRGPIVINITDSTSVIIDNEAFSWIRSATISQVANLDIREKAFYLNPDKINTSHHGGSTKITLEKSNLEVLPAYSFPSLTAEIKIIGCKIGTIQSNAFSAQELYNVAIQNSTINNFESGAFNARSLLKTLHFDNLRIKELRAGAILSAVSNFTLSSSNIGQVFGEAFNMSKQLSAYYSRNTFGHIHTKGVSLNNWLTLILENNTFQKLEETAIEMVATDYNEFRFVGNVIEYMTDSTLTFIFRFNSSATTTSDNVFIDTCVCEPDAWLQRYVEADSKIFNDLLNTGYCNIQIPIKGCFTSNYPFMQIVNFRDQLCNENATIRCDDIFKTITNPNIGRAAEILKRNQAQYEWTQTLMLGMIYLFVSCMIAYSMLVLLQCVDEDLPCRLCYCLIPFRSSLLSQATVTNSIVHFSITDYESSKDAATELREQPNQDLSGSEERDEGDIGHQYETVNKAEDNGNGGCESGFESEDLYSGSDTTTTNRRAEFYDSDEPLSTPSDSKADKVEPEKADEGLPTDPISGQGAELPEYAIPNRKNASEFADGGDGAAPFPGEHEYAELLTVAPPAEYQEPVDSVVSEYAELVDPSYRPLPELPADDIQYADAD